jgi:predicted CoA-substrate-specific enzyme activase
MIKQAPSQHALRLGVDIGSVASKLVLIDSTGKVLHKDYRRHQGQGLDTLIAMLKELPEATPSSTIEHVALTGAGAKRLADRLGLAHVNEVVCQAEAVAATHPDVKTIIEVGGEDSKLIKLKTDPRGNGGHGLEDFHMNAVCAAGTGSFLDQQATRLGIDIDGEFGELALKSAEPPRVAGRCSVFAKSDMIHLQQQATPDYDIVAGLCFAMARNFRGQLAQGVAITPPVAFQGGVASNAGVVRAFREVLGLEDGDLIIPDHYNVMGALGAVLKLASENLESPFPGIEAIERFAADTANLDGAGRLDPLGFFPGAEERHYVLGDNADLSAVGDEAVGYLGVDVGSVSTNVVLLDNNAHLLAKSYLPTAGRPLEAVRQGLKEVAEAIGKPIRVLGAGTTGSGRYLTGDFIGADIVVNEITAQATGAAFFDPEVDTIFEIGGQDSKYISLENGVVVDFEMNHVCAAGTGSFLEEQAEKLGIDIKGEFAELALSSESPVKLGERCTVFMESDLLHHMEEGHQTPELVAGLSYSIVGNYLNRVVGRHKVGRNIFFQGGTAANRAVVAAFEKVTGCPITVPRHHDVTGAVGMALLAKQNAEKTGGAASTFRGFDLSDRTYSVESFTCSHCANECEIKKVVIEGQEPLFYGSRCDRYNLKKSAEDDRGIPDLFADRERYLLEAYNETREKTKAARAEGGEPPRIGLPWALFYHELMPFWATFVGEIGAEPVLSGRSTKGVIRSGVESVLAETCFPVKVMHGHVKRLMDMKVDRVLLPSILNMTRAEGENERSCLCPYVQTIPYQIEAAFDFTQVEATLSRPVVSFRWSPKKIAEALEPFAREVTGASPQQVRDAVEKALGAQEIFARRCHERGREVLDNLSDYPTPTVVISRPYNGPDFGMNLELPRKLRDLGVTAIPLDFLPLETVHVESEIPNMYWKYGQKIVAGARIVRDTVGLGAVYITNFGCGPDSFLVTFVKNMLGQKPSLVLEIDEHSADAGVITRCEAFLDSRRNRGEVTDLKANLVKRLDKTECERTLYLPHMCESAHALAAAFEAYGIKAEALPPSDDESLDLGRRYTTGKECLPAILTAGDMLRKIREPGFDPKRAAFFMPSGTGPCRFGQYNTLHRMILKEVGHEDIPIVSPNQGRQFYRDFAQMNNRVTRWAWQGVVAIDVLTKALHTIRPYEVNPGETDRIYQELIEGVCDVLRSKGNLPAMMRQAAARMQAIPVDRTEPRPRIGIVGEIFVRSQEFANQEIVRRLESLGAECELAPFAEWIFYINFTRSRETRELGDWGGWFGNLVKDTVQRYDERRVAGPFRRVIHNAVEPKVTEALAHADPFIDNSFEGETCLSVGKAIEFYHQGCSGIVNVMPFTCMPGNIVSSLLKKVRTTHDGIPILSIPYDGTRHASTPLRLEAFVYQAKEYMERVEGIGV